MQYKKLMPTARIFVLLADFGDVVGVPNRSVSACLERSF